MLNTQNKPLVEVLPIPSVQKNFDEDGEMNENFYRDPSLLESDANYFGTPAEF